MIITSTV